MTTRTIKAECTSGDAATLQISTEVQNDVTAMSFEIGGLTVYVDRFDLDDLRRFIEAEQQRYETDFPYEPDEDDEPDDGGPTNPE